MKIEWRVLVLNIQNYAPPTYVTMDSLSTNLIDAYGSTASYDEYGTVILIVQPNNIFPEATTLYNTFVTVTFPWDGTTQFFPKNPGGLIQCRMQTYPPFMQEGYFGRHCLWTPGPPDTVTFYVPKELRVDPSLGRFQIELSTVGVVPPLENGFLYPIPWGYYRFIVNMNKNTGANIEQAEPLLHMEGFRPTVFYTTSEHKGAGLYNIHMFNYRVTTAVPASTDAITPGFIFFKFPFDYFSTGAGWKSDLGTGLIDGNEITCLQGVLHTAPAMKCYLIYGYATYVTLKVTFTSEVKVGDNVNLYIGKIENPTINLHDFEIEVSSQYQDLTSRDKPNWVMLDRKINKYVETSWSLSPNTGQQAPANAPAYYGYTTVTNPRRFVYGDKLTVEFSIFNSGNIVTAE